MIKYIPTEVAVTFAEVPDEVSLCISISNCQNRCPGCHSPHLRQDIGEELTHAALDNLIGSHDGITCVCFMGEGNDPSALQDAAEYVHSKYPDLMLGIYSGRKEVEQWFYGLFDYVKIGPYVEELGPLDRRGTNQRMLAVNHPRKACICSDWYIMDITDKFWRR